MLKETKLPTYEYEDAMIDKGYNFIVGVDEAGRGPGAGPVVAGAVWMPSIVIPYFQGKINDSKKLTAKKRTELYDLITSKCGVGVGIINNNIIDEVNILEATKMAMIRAINELPQPDYVLIDGTVVLKNIGCPQRQLIKGDSLSLSIAAGSIIAKVIRDSIMGKLHEEYPIYGWDTNKGYLTEKHMAAIKEYGPCIYHRLTFKKVKEYV